MDDHDLGLVLFGDAVVELGIGDPSKSVAEAKPERLHLVPVAWGGGERESIDAIGRLRLEPHDLFRKFPQVLEHDRIVIERIRRTEQAAPMTKAALGHRFNHHVDVATVIEVPVADGDGIQPGEVDLALGVLDDGAWSRIKGDPRQSVFHVQAAGRSELLGDHEPRAGSAHESDLHSCPPRLRGGPALWAGVGAITSATSLKGSLVGPPKY